MNRKKIIQAIIFLIAGVILFWYVYRDIEIDEIKDALANLKYSWIVLSFAFGLMSHFIRALRWKMLIVPMGYKTNTFTLFLSILVLYFTNLIVPRGGEVARCGVITKYENIPFTKLLGTVFVERITDLLAFLLIFLLIIIWQLDFLRNLLINNTELTFNYDSIKSKLYILIALILIAVILYFILRKINLFKGVFEKINKLKQNFTEGIKAVVKTDSKILYITYTFGIFIMWLLMLYVVFFAYEPTQHLSLKVAVLTYVVGTLAYLLPIQAGIGVWHLLVIQCLMVYGINENDGKIFALIAHTFTNLIYLFFGAVGFVLLPFANKNTNHISNTNNS